MLHTMSTGKQSVNFQRRVMTPPSRLSRTSSTWIAWLWSQRQHMPPKCWLTIYQLKQLNIPEDLNLHQHHQKIPYIEEKLWNI